MISADVLAKLAGRLGGLPVLGCRPNSPAALAGIRYGDILLSVNGQPTPDWASYIEARGQSAGVMVVEVFRGGEVVTERLVLRERTEPIDAAALLEELVEQRAASGRVDGEEEPEPS